MNGIEQEKPKVNTKDIKPVRSFAEKWIEKRNIKPSPESPASSVELPIFAREAYDLFLEKQDLKSSIVRRTKEEIEGKDSNPPSLEEKLRLLNSGKVGDILASFETKQTLKEVVGRSNKRIGEIEQRLDHIFSTPGVFNEYQEFFHQQMRLTQEAREVMQLERLKSEINLTAMRLTRDARVEGRNITSVEQNLIGDNRVLLEHVEQRKSELLKDPDVFDRVVISERLLYKEELRKDRFAETPSRKKYLEKIERYWADGKKVLLTGETGTGKTELVKHSSIRLFGVNPEFVTGHGDMSIYELLGKTGFRVKEGDVFRPAPMIQAMTGREGKGQPFLFDEIDRAPNKAIMGVKTILNARPGDKGIKVQTDSEGSFDIGPDYAASATANIKSEKHTTATELDPAIVRVFDAPMDIDYMPANEVYELALASLMDKRGGIPLSENDAKTSLKNLCDAASWIQDAYQGRKIVTESATDKSKEKILEARGQATTGKPATLKKALLDPGRTLDMLRGWRAAQTGGITFKEYINEQILDFINNRAYPEEDRYYLTEIFALKGFLKGHSVTELMVSGLDQKTLETWTGEAGIKQADKKADSEYLPWTKVAKLDPYNTFKSPAAADAEELLNEPEKLRGDQAPKEKSEAEKRLQKAKEILGEDFLGPQAIEKAFGVRLGESDIPVIPFSEEEIRRAKELEQFLILRIDTAPDGKPLTMEKMQELLQPKFDKEGKGRIFDGSDMSIQDLFTKEKPRAKWALVSKGILPDSVEKNHLQQTEMLADYLEKEVFKGTSMPKEYQEAIKEFNEQKAYIKSILSSDEMEAAKRLSDLKLNKLTRQTPVEFVYDRLVYFLNNNKKLFEHECTLTSSCTPRGYFALVGTSEPVLEGVHMSYWGPDDSAPGVGVAFARRGKEEASRAMEILGQDFLGVEAIKKMEKELKNIGVDVEFILDEIPPFPYSEKDLQIAKDNGEMLVLRPKKMSILVQKEAFLKRWREKVVVSINLFNFSKLFPKDPTKRREGIIDHYNFNEFKKEKFVNDPTEIKSGWSLVKKEVLANSTNRNWDNQEKYLKMYQEDLKKKGATNVDVGRRTAAEVYWDTVLYYINNGELLLQDSSDWTKSCEEDGKLIFAGTTSREPKYNSLGMEAEWAIESKVDRDSVVSKNRGVCPSR